MGRGWHSGWTTAASSDYFFSNFFEKFPGPSEIQAVFLQLSDEQRCTDLDRPTRRRHIRKRSSTPANFRPVFSQPKPNQSVVELDRPTGSSINSVRPMNMKRIAVAALLAATVAQASPPPPSAPLKPSGATDGVISLTVFISIEPHPKKVDGSTHEAFLRAILTNVSNHTVTLPTTTYDGKPCCWGHGEKDEWILFRVGYERLEDGKLIKPSPWKFCPVSLKPGESTELPEYSLGNSGLIRGAVSFTVDFNYAAEQSWWAGTLRADNQRQLDEPNPEGRVPR